MNILVTGATSKIGQILIPELLKNLDIQKFYILTRTNHPTGVFQLLNDKRIEFVHGDLLKDLHFLDESKQIDLCLHMAAITHSFDRKKYYELNQEATSKLAAHLYNGGCKQFIYLSSQTAGIKAGAYAESKFNSEKKLLEMPWLKLLIIRPAEVIGVGSKEGLDKLENLSKKVKIYPWLIGFKKIQFSPLKIEDLVRFIGKTLKEDLRGTRIQILRGPHISSTELAIYFWKKYHSIPVPIFTPILRFVNRMLGFCGIKLFPKDQISRMFGVRGQSPSHKVEIEEVIFESPYLHSEHSQC
ncbi:MAG: NAD-dependent epimerase/dehydratase family protein [Bdellovibrionota bacterium]